jgi:hypothetical protein
MHDLVYHLSSEAAQNNDWELRMSLRGFWAHYPREDLGRLWIIGHRPAWLRADLCCHVPWPDPWRQCKDANLIGKLIRMSLEPALSAEFIACSDDHIPVSAFDWGFLRPWHEGPLKSDPSTQTGWQQRVANTGRWLRSQGVERPLALDAHIPYPMAKGLLPELLRAPFGEGLGLCTYSLYFGLTGYQAERARPIGSERVRGSFRGGTPTPESFEARLTNGNRFIALDAGSAGWPWLRERVERHLPEPSPWEAD